MVFLPQSRIVEVIQLGSLLPFHISVFWEVAQLQLPKIRRQEAGPNSSGRFAILLLLILHSCNRATVQNQEIYLDQNSPQIQIQRLIE
jgi:hypothetical protein